MNFRNEKVTHDHFGKGVVVDYSGDYVVVNFSSGKKKFVFPDAFGNFLRLSDKKTSAAMESIIEEKDKERKRQEAERAEALEKELGL